MRSRRESCYTWWLCKQVELRLNVDLVPQLWWRTCDPKERVGMPGHRFPKESNGFPLEGQLLLYTPMETWGKLPTYLYVQKVYFLLWLTSYLFQSFGFYFHQIKQPFAVADFFGPLDIQGCCAEVFKRLAQVNNLLEKQYVLAQCNYHDGELSSSSYCQEKKAQIPGIHLQ